MFTPPPSPLPSSLSSFPFPNPPVPSPPPSPPLSSQQLLTPGPALSSHPPEHDGHGKRLEMCITIQNRKRRIAWYTRLVVIAVPLVLVLAAFFKRFASRPLFLDLLDEPSPGAPAFLDSSTGGPGHPTRLLHRRGRGMSTKPVAIVSSVSSVSTVVFPSITSTPTTTQAPSQTVPTIPSSPPDLPTPFPQPFDTTLGSNFTTTSCENFFLNMTQSLPFRQCRPFSFLSQTSSEFLQAQSNITLLNIDVWGTCNTPVSADNCASNMEWFTSSLLDACSQEKGDHDQLIKQTLDSLRLYTLMRQVACLADQKTSTYCYIEAANNSNSSDLYFYSLPYGIPLPNDTVPSCSDCTKNVMSLYGLQLNQTDGLKATYNPAAKLASSRCGSTYAQSAIVSSSSALRWIGGHPSTIWTLAPALCVLFMGLI